MIALFYFPFFFGSDRFSALVNASQTIPGFSSATHWLVAHWSPRHPVGPSARKVHTSKQEIFPCVFSFPMALLFSDAVVLTKGDPLKQSSLLLIFFFFYVARFISLGHRPRSRRTLI